MVKFGSSVGFVELVMTGKLFLSIMFSVITFFNIEPFDDFFEEFVDDFVDFCDDDESVGVELSLVCDFSFKEKPKDLKEWLLDMRALMLAIPTKALMTCLNVLICIVMSAETFLTKCS